MPSTKTNAPKEATNRRLKRHISRCHNGRYSLFTFDRISQEIYTFVRTDVPAAEAIAWVDNQPYNPPQRRLSRSAVTDAFTDASRSVTNLTPPAYVEQITRIYAQREEQEVVEVIAAAQASGRSAAAAFLRHAWDNR